ncbi:hypothetical protein MFTT_47900 [Mycolicibacterium fortuitum subsp. fortuitum]|nr:hypothetical protein MFTT_47900 [Mycolicibacterium fortuitum subsp. fortuitum]CRL58210.1 hypothetical protein CPGR_05553 [Mycolicibacterium fortuitum subsp. fortuitum DSM 46621 = ATCC 6841 = JCM 6387]CRL74028.1 hypothetical protein CPGR_01218 [Mycolicibacter nonchromogenicus]
MAEGWFRASAEAAQHNPSAAPPLWIAIDDLDSSLEVHVQREIGLHTLETIGADIVIDGLDQRADRAERTVGYAASLTHRWPRSRVVLTSRATHNAREELIVRASPMPRPYGRKLAESISGSTQLGNLRPEVEEALERPLFALLIGQGASLHEFTTMTEVIEGVVRKIVGRESIDLYPHLRHLATLTTTSARPVDPESFVDFDVAARLRESPFLTESAHGLSFSLATFEQWFAARAVLEGSVSVDDILNGLPSFDRWKYVFSMVLAAGEPSRVDPVMARIARWNPGAIAWVINDAESSELGRFRSDSSTGSQHEMAYRLRFALEAILDGLGPLAMAFTPLSFPGVESLPDLSLGLEFGGGRVHTTWLASNRSSGRVLPPVIDASVDFSTDGSFAIETAEMPATRNWVWTTARNILASDLSEQLTSLAIRLASQHEGIVRREVEDLSRRLESTGPNDLDELGRGLYGNIYPLPDVPPGPTGWPSFSLEAVANRVRAVVASAIQCYLEICETVAPRFGDTLAHKGLMPFEYYADMSYRGPGSGGPFSLGPAEPGIRWLLRPVGTPLPNGQRRGENSVNMTVNDEQRSQEILDDRQTFGDAYFEYIANVPGLRPFADSFSLSTGRFDIIDKKPATHIAIGWFWDDLKNLKWVEGQKPPDRTE